MSTIFNKGTKLCRSFSQAISEKFYPTTNHQTQSFIDSSFEVGSIATSKLTHTPLRTFQGAPKQIVNIHPVSHHSFELLIPQKQIEHEYSYQKWSTSPTEKKLGFHLVVLFLVILATASEVYAAENPVNEPPRQIKNILNTLPAERSTDDIIELFNYLYDEGEKEANKAKGKNVVIVFGDTGAGKSTFIDFIWGCDLQANPDDPSIIEMKPNSRVKEVAPIGSEASSCTLVPKMVGDLEAVLLSPERTVKLSFYDMPGLSDNRGFEVDLAAAITMRKIIEIADSVIFVMLYEYPIKTVRGTGWAETAALFTERFGGTQWKGGNNLSLVITHVPSDVKIDSIKKDIIKYTPVGSEDLSHYATTYNPLNPADRDIQLDIIDKTKKYQRHEIKIVMKKAQRWESNVLGDKLEIEIYEDLEKNKIHHAKQKVKFACGIAELGNKDLSKVLKNALDGVHNYSNDLIATMEKDAKSPETRYPYLKKYKKIKENFGDYTSFNRHDSDATNVRNQLSDGRSIAWDKPKAAFVGTVATVGAGAATGAGIAAAGSATITVAAVTVAAAPVIAVVGGIATVGCLGFTLYSGLCWLRPSQEDVATSAYFESI